MPDLVSGTRIRAADHPPAVFEQDATAQLNITSNSYITGTPVVDQTFVAPTSGRVLLAVGGGGRDNDATPAERALIAPQVFEGTDATGVEIVPPAASRRGIMSMNTSDGYGRWSRITLLEGLTPERTYYARVMHRALHPDDPTTLPDSADILPREIAVISVP